MINSLNVIREALANQGRAKASLEDRLRKAEEKWKEAKEVLLAIELKLETTEGVKMRLAFENQLKSWRACLSHA